jgi:hypothetical protein
LILANLGGFVPQKGEDGTGEQNPRRHYSAAFMELKIGTSAPNLERGWPQITTKMRRLCCLCALCASGFRASRDARLEFIDRHDVSG